LDIAAFGVGVNVNQDGGGDGDGVGYAVGDAVGEAVGGGVGDGVGGCSAHCGTQTAKMCIMFSDQLLFKNSKLTHLSGFRCQVLGVRFCLSGFTYDG
jgi:hypothetical protein